ncbi:MULTISPECIES: sensor histidine kinase [unclassified Paracoccus (in: a-proteobacteria)]|uniref:sensor histidine kinase n=1 Tax=unclassified Paracoccus (in: a-proteobacteria) TaxID=2688777 RepID=UPI0012B29691|nr:MULTISPECIES: ATP-binding protein [unclassified Paracoccus (in: a-proteobacteria)]UXU76459.1 ATP-binding protein [Paracoccus sp. SMMA_5]UXU82203.1 ATP-binding protein [Paracoccus sp. SMMA_5_TC]
MTAFPKAYSRKWLTLVLGLASLGLALWAVGYLAFRQAYGQGAGRAETALRLTVDALEADLARYEMVPQLVGQMELIRKLAVDPQDSRLRDRANRWLARQNAALQSADIYVILPDGETIAHSNFRGPNSFIGQNFSYRPYFIDAMAGQTARFYGIGTTSGIRGYYFSAPVWDDSGHIAAVVAVKIGVDRFEQAWHRGEYRVLVTDPEGVVFLSSRPEWRYKGTLSLTEERRSRSAGSRRYADTVLTELPLQRLERHGASLWRLTDTNGTREYLVASEIIPDAGWSLHVLLDTAEMRAQARLVVTTALLLIWAAGFAGLMWRQRRLQAAERQAMQAYATAELERRVEARTADLARVNSKLQQEIAERRATEAKLRAAQDSLVQAGKLAALGQMSASLSHEINQPLAAARNYADSAAILIQRGELDRARDNIAQIMALIDRMAAIGAHLRQAARKPDEVLGPVDLAELIAETRVIVGPRLTVCGADLVVDLPDNLPPLRASATRLQQVLVNLISNAADAVADSADRRILLTADAGSDEVTIRLRDFGPGVPPHIAERIFDPFFTTKGMGAGLGLGLSITANIVRDFGGRISLHHPGTGAEFRVTLPIATSHLPEAELAR